MTKFNRGVSSRPHFVTMEVRGNAAMDSARHARQRAVLWTWLVVLGSVVGLAFVILN